MKASEEKVKNNWKEKILGMKTAYEKDKQKLQELNLRRRKKFDELRQSAQTNNTNSTVVVEAPAGEHEEEEEGEGSIRRVNIDDEQNRFVISVDTVN